MTTTYKKPVKISKKKLSRMAVLMEMYKKTGIFAEILNLGDEYYLSVKRKPESKKIMFLLLFDNEGNIVEIVAGKSDTSVLWVKTKNTTVKKQKNEKRKSK